MPGPRQLRQFRDALLVQKQLPLVARYLETSLILLLPVKRCPGGER